MRKLIPWICLILLLVGFVVPAGLVLAAYDNSYEIEVFNNSASTYSNGLPVLVTLNNTQLVNYGYLDADGMDTNVQEGAADRAFMMHTARLGIFFPSFQEASTRVVHYRLGNVPGQDNCAIITGIGGNITVTDNATWELGNNFEAELSGYYDTSSTTGLYPVNKADAFGFVTINGYIGAIIRDFTEILSQTSRSSVYNCYGDTWRGQTFTASSTTYLSRVFIYANPVNSPTDLTLHIRATEGGLPTGPDLVTVVNSTLSSFIELPRPFLMTEGEVYAFAISCTGNVANYMNTEYMNSNQYAGGQLVYSENGGTSWTAVSTYDYNFALYTSPYVSYAGTSGDYVVKATADETDLKLYIDGNEEDSVALDGASVPDNANPWVLTPNGYLGYYKHTVGGTLVGHFQPNTLIAGSTLTDRAGGDQNGTINWGSNPAGIEVTIGALTSAVSTTSSLTADTETVPNLLDPIPSTEVIPEVADEELVQMPLYTNVKSMADSLGMTTYVAYVLLIWLTSVAFGVAGLIALGSSWGFICGYGVVHIIAMGTPVKVAFFIITGVFVVILALFLWRNH